MTAPTSTALSRRRRADGARTPPGPLREFWSYFSANRGAVAGLVFVVAVLLMAAFAHVHRAAPARPHQQRRVPASRRRGRPAARGRIRSAPTRSAATSCRA